MFDIDQFMSSATTEANSTSLEPIPVGEYTGIIDEVKLTPRDDRYPLDITWVLTDADLQAKLGRDRITVRQTVWLDMKPEGGLDTGKGKNVGLGRLREALGLNAPGKPFSLSMLRGAGPAIVSVTQQPKKDDDSIIYNNVKGVTRCG